MGTDAKPGAGEEREIVLIDSTPLRMASILGMLGSVAGGLPHILVVPDAPEPKREDPVRLVSARARRERRNLKRLKESR